MTQTISDVEVNEDDWKDILSEAGLDGGVSVRVQNKSSTPVIVHFAPTKPDVKNSDGFVLRPYRDIDIGNEPFIWVKGKERSFLNIEAI